MARIADRDAQAAAAREQEAQNANAAMDAFMKQVSWGSARGADKTRKVGAIEMETRFENGRIGIDWKNKTEKCARVLQTAVDIRRQIDDRFCV